MAVFDSLPRLLITLVWQTMTSLHQGGAEDERYANVHLHVLNPKAGCIPPLKHTHTHTTKQDHFQLTIVTCSEHHHG